MTGNRFHQLHSKTDTKRKLHAASERKFEDKLVEFVCKRNGLARLHKDLVRRQGIREDDPFLTFALFNDTFPSYPLMLGSTRLEGKELHKEKNAVFPRWLTTFRGLPFVDPYHEFLESLGAHAELASAGLVFPRKGFRQGLIIYNGGLDEHKIKGGVFVYEGGTKKRPITYHVRPFAAVVDGIYNHGRGWKPDNLYEDGLPN